MKRFFDKISKTKSCWIWLGCLRGKSGYGAFKLNNKVIDAHRVSYEIHNGEIPKGFYVCHTCDNRKCVNPKHLFLGTAKDNWKDGYDKGRIKLLGGIKHKKTVKHPSVTSYRKYNCRCNECKLLHNEAIKKYRKSLKQNVPSGTTINPKIK